MKRKESQIGSCKIVMGRKYSMGNIVNKVAITAYGSGWGTGSPEGNTV